MTTAPDPIIAAIEALPPLRDVIRRAGLDARKSLGQNFLLDLNLTGRIARTAASADGALDGPLNGLIVEVGPGPGGLTRALLMAGAQNIIAIERDARAHDALAPLVAAAGGRLRILAEDALRVDLAALIPPGTRCHIIANLPYNIATALLLKWLGQIESIASMTLMFQREVAVRITAAPGHHAYGRLSVISQWLCEADMLFDIPPQAFVPPPKVISTVLRLRPRVQPLAVADRATLEEVTRVLFGQRRKMLRVSAKPLGGGALLDAAGVDGAVRPEVLPVEAFCALAEALRHHREI